MTSAARSTRCWREGQIEGGIAQGIGLALMEEYLPGRTENLHDYLIPTFGDVPPIESLLIEVPDPEGPFGAKGLGEHVLIPTAPAILNAIRHATGAEITASRLPHRVCRIGADMTRAVFLPNIPGVRGWTPAATRRRPMTSPEKIRCDACPVMCYIAPGQTGACDRYANADGRIVRTDPVVMLSHTVEDGGRVVPFAARDWDGEPVPADAFVTGIGVGHHLSRLQARALHRLSQVEGADMVTVVTEAIFSYCGRQGEDRHRPLPWPRRRRGAGGGRGDRPCHDRRIRQPDAVAGRRASPDRRRQGRGPGRPARRCWRFATARRWNWPSTAARPSSCRRGARRSSTASPRTRMRVGCGSATIGMFAVQWQGLVDEVVVVDDHITGVGQRTSGGQGASAGSRRASGSRATARPPAATSGCPSRARAGAARG